MNYASILEARRPMKYLQESALAPPTGRMLVLHHLLALRQGRLVKTQNGLSHGASEVLMGTLQPCGCLEW